MPNLKQKVFDNSKINVISMHYMPCLGDNLDSNNENMYFLMTEYGINMNMS